MEEILNKLHRRRGPELLILILLAAATIVLPGCVNAAKPLVCGENDSCAAEAPYDLGELPDFASDVQWPAKPDPDKIVVIPTTVNGDFVANCIGCEYDAEGSTINGNVTRATAKMPLRYRW